MATTRRSSVLPDQIMLPLEIFEAYKSKHSKQNREIIHKNSELMHELNEMVTQIKDLRDENLALRITKTKLQKQIRSLNLRRNGPNNLSAPSADVMASVKSSITALQGFLSLTEQLSLKQSITYESPPMFVPRPQSKPLKRTRKSDFLRMEPNLSFIAECDATIPLEEFISTEHCTSSEAKLPDPHDIFSSNLEENVAGSFELPISTITVKRGTGASRDPPLSFDVSPSAMSTMSRRKTRRASGVLPPIGDSITVASPKRRISRVLDDSNCDKDESDGYEEPAKRRKAALPKKKAYKSTPAAQNVQVEIRCSSEGLATEAIEFDEELQFVEPELTESLPILPETKPLPPAKKARAKRATRIETVLGESDVNSTEPTTGEQPEGVLGAVVEEDTEGRRARKSVNYTLPKLNTKMRRPVDYIPITTHAANLGKGASKGGKRSSARSKARPGRNSDGVGIFSQPVSNTAENTPETESSLTPMTSQENPVLDDESESPTETPDVWNSDDIPGDQIALEMERQRKERVKLKITTGRRHTLAS